MTIIKKQRWARLASILCAGTILVAGCGQQGSRTDTSAEAEKGVIKLAYVNWAEGVAVMHLVSTLITDMGYRVEQTMADVAPIYTSVAEGNQDVMIETWLPHTHQSYYAQYGDRVDLLGTWFEQARIGLVVPAYVTIDSIADMAGTKDQFKGRITGIDSGAGIMSATEKAMEHYGLSFELIASSEPAMAAALQGAIEKGEWIAVTGWSPHWKFARYDLKYLEDPGGLFGSTETIHAAARKGFSTDHPEIASILSKMKFDAGQIGSLMDAMDGIVDGQEEPAVRAWIAKNEALVKSWLP